MMVKGTLIADTEDGRRIDSALFLGKAEPGIHDPVLADPVLVAIAGVIGINLRAVDDLVGGPRTGAVDAGADNIVDMLGGPSDVLNLGFEEGDGPHVVNLPATHPALDGGPERWKSEIAYIITGSARLQLDGDVSIHVSLSNDGTIQRLLTVPPVPYATAPCGYVPLGQLFSFPGLDRIGATGRLIPGREHATIHVMIA